MSTSTAIQDAAKETILAIRGFKSGDISEAINPIPLLAPSKKRHLRNHIVPDTYPLHVTPEAGSQLLEAFGRIGFYQQSINMATFSAVDIYPLVIGFLSGTLDTHAEYHLPDATPIGQPSHQCIGRLYRDALEARQPFAFHATLPTALYVHAGEPDTPGFFAIVNNGLSVTVDSESSVAAVGRSASPTLELKNVRVGITMPRPGVRSRPNGTAWWGSEPAYDLALSADFFERASLMTQVDTRLSLLMSYASHHNRKVEVSEIVRCDIN